MKSYKKCMYLDNVVKYSLCKLTQFSIFFFGKHRYHFETGRFSTLSHIEHCNTLTDIKELFSINLHYTWNPLSEPLKSKQLRINKCQDACIKVKPSITTFELLLKNEHY